MGLCLFHIPVHFYKYVPIAFHDIIKKQMEGQWNKWLVPESSMRVLCTLETAQQVTQAESLGLTFYFSSFAVYFRSQEEFEIYNISWFPSLFPNPSFPTSCRPSHPCEDISVGSTRWSGLQQTQPSLCSRQGGPPKPTWKDCHFRPTRKDGDHIYSSMQSNWKKKWTKSIYI